jgi:Protein of unknown function (DUF1275)
MLMMADEQANLVLAFAKVLYVNGQATEQTVSVAERLARARVLHATIMPRWGELAARGQRQARPRLEQARRSLGAASAQRSVCPAGCGSVFSVPTRPSTNPHGLMAGIATMMAVSAMACQDALLRLPLPKVVSTAVMTGNLTNPVLSLMEMLLTRGSFKAPDSKLKNSLRLLVGFLVGCLVAAAVFFLLDWT